MDGLLRTLKRSRNSPTRGGGGRGRNRRDSDNDNGGGGRNRQFELILEMLARGLVEYAVRKYVPGQGGDNRERRQDDRLRTRGDHRDDRGGVPNVDVEMLEHIGRSILSKAMEKFGGGGEGLREEGGHARRAGSVDRDAHSREREREAGRRDHEQRDEERHQRRRSPSRRRDEGEDEHRRRRRRGRHGTDYGPLKTELEALSNTLISLNERQPGHADCEFYDAFVERSGKVQDGIGAVLVQIREREERREERRGRRR
ncbi:hypothetical protein CPLU01_08682 [Colletotrichum plurivorum]|uniref:Uncharacterized protein n=1 Tax=Colletotrichum plurivorum TaxID=2175906 RepID=A0A8H6KC37_9PEZI|nr:hypothetical protein CPLU01_08682 [Colletotrichum plurivorum]